VVVFEQCCFVGKRECNRKLNLVFGLVLAVTTLSFTFYICNIGQGILAAYLFYIVGDALLVYEFLFFELTLGYFV